MNTNSTTNIGRINVHSSNNAAQEDAEEAKEHDI